MEQEGEPEVRELTKHVYESFLLDEWPRAAGIVDFGLRSTQHYGALQWAVKSEGVTVVQLDQALGKGPALQALISETNPYRNVVFETDYDDMPQELYWEMESEQQGQEEQEEQKQTIKPKL